MFNTTFKDRILKIAIEESKKSTYPHKIGCVIFRKKTVISYDHNYECSHRNKLHPRFQRVPTTIHAEVATIIKAKTDLKHCEMLVVRVNKQNKLLLAKPCNWCMEYIKYIGIKKVYYSINNFPYIEELSVRKIKI